MLRVVTFATVTPFLAFRVQPSQRIRLTVPLVEMRLLMVTFWLTTYQVVLPASPHTVVLAPTTV